MLWSQCCSLLLAKTTLEIPAGHRAESQSLHVGFPAICGHPDFAYPCSRTALGCCCVMLPPPHKANPPLEGSVTASTSEWQKNCRHLHAARAAQRSMPTAAGKGQIHYGMMQGVWSVVFALRAWTSELSSLRSKDPKTSATFNLTTDKTPPYPRQKVYNGTGI